MLCSFLFGRALVFLPVILLASLLAIYLFEGFHAPRPRAPAPLLARAPQKSTPFGLRGCAGVEDELLVLHVRTGSRTLQGTITNELALRAAPIFLLRSLADMFATLARLRTWP